MKVELYAIRDVNVGFYSPSVDSNDASAKRNFAMMINSDAANNIMGFAPKDFDLYHLGTFDTDTGKLESLEMPELVVHGLSVVGG